MQLGKYVNILYTITEFQVTLFLSFHKSKHLLNFKFVTVNKMKWKTFINLFLLRDNLDTDIYGANLCHEYLKAFHTTTGNNGEQLKSSCHQSKQNRINWLPEVKSIESILVQTGVSQQDDSKPSNGDGARFLHRDTVYLPHLRRANHVVENIAEAVELILKQEQESPVWPESCGLRCCV